MKAEKQFRFEVNELSWNKDNDLFFVTNGQVRNATPFKDIELVTCNLSK